MMNGIFVMKKIGVSMYIFNGGRNRKTEVMNCKREFCLLKKWVYESSGYWSIFEKKEDKEMEDGEEERQTNEKVFLIMGLDAGEFMLIWGEF